MTVDLPWPPGDGSAEAPLRDVLAALLRLLSSGAARIEGTGLPGRSDKLLNPVANVDAPTIEPTKVHQK